MSTDSSGTGLSQDFHLDTAGNVDTVTERLSAASTVTRSFAYDGLDRLKSQKNGATTVEAFAYDATGNRTSKTVGSTTTAYSYGAGNHRLASVGSAARTYDNNGNTTLLGPSNNATTFTYDDRNRLREVRVKNKLKASYRYNGLGQRVLKTDAVTPANSRQYVYDSAGHLLGEYTLAGLAVKEYVWLDDTLIAILSDFDGSTYQFVETDHLGTPRAVVHPTENTILWRWDLNPTAFGEHLPNGNPDGDAFTYSLNLRYPGQYFDAENGLHYNYFRDYEPATGRYIESDPIGLRGGANTYSYVAGSPLRYRDPFGLFRFGTRPLEGSPVAIPIFGSNIGVLHEQGFFDDGTNVGYFPQGIRADTKSYEYEMSGPYYEDELMRSALETLRRSGRFEPEDPQDSELWENENDYDLIEHNCQDFADALRTEYTRLGGTTCLIRFSDGKCKL